MATISHKSAHSSPKTSHHTKSHLQKEQPNKSMSMSEKGKSWLIKNEGTVTKTTNGVVMHILYDDSLKFATIGYGHLVSKESIKHADNDPAQKLYISGITEIEAQNLLIQDLKFHVDGIRKNTTKVITQPQFDTLVSLSFNAGRSALAKSKIISFINKGDYNKAAEAVKAFRVGGGNGPRRRRESSNFSLGDYK